MYLHIGKSFYEVSGDPTQIQTEIMTNGPVEGKQQLRVDQDKFNVKRKYTNIVCLAVYGIYQLLLLSMGTFSITKAVCINTLLVNSLVRKTH